MAVELCLILLMSCLLSFLIDTEAVCFPDHNFQVFLFQLPNMEERRATSALIKEERVDGAPGGSSPPEMLRMDEGSRYKTAKDMPAHACLQ